RLERAEEQDEDDEDDERDDDGEPRQRSLLVLETPAPHERVLGGKHDRCVDLPHRFSHEPAHVTAAYAPLDADAAEIAVADDLAEPVFLGELGELGEWNALAARRADREAAQARELLVALHETHREIEATFAFEDLGDDSSLGGCFDRVLNVLHVDPV